MNKQNTESSTPSRRPNHGTTYIDDLCVDTEECPPGHLYELFDEVASNVMGTFAFQIGPIKEVGVNGLTSEAVLTMLIDRTKKLNQKFACQENEDAIRAMETAVAAFDLRTSRRILRGVEGTNKA